MHIYSDKQLYNLYVQQQADAAFGTGCIDKESHAAILLNHKLNLYTPNYFIRIAVALLTVVAVLFSGLLLGLIFSVSSADSITILLIVLACVHYAALEILTQRKAYYNAGVDNVLMLSSAACFISAFSVNNYADQPLITSSISLIAFGLIAIRFTDAFMLMLACIALFAQVFFACLKVDVFAKEFVPLVLMLLSAIIYLLAEKLLKNRKLKFHFKSFNWIVLLSLCSFYFFGNYFVVKQLLLPVWSGRSGFTQVLSYEKVFWFFTGFTPLAYIGYGLVKRRLIFVRLGFVFCVLSVLTFRYYYSVMPIEMAMLLAGAAFACPGYLLTRYLRKPRHGFVFEKTGKRSIEGDALENLLLLEAAQGEQSPNDNLQFGDGDFGGAGAGDKY